MDELEISCLFSKLVVSVALSPSAHMTSEHQITEFLLRKVLHLWKTKTKFKTNQKM